MFTLCVCLFMICIGWLLWFVVFCIGCFCLLLFVFSLLVMLMFCAYSLVVSWYVDYGLGCLIFGDLQLYIWLWCSLDVGVCVDYHLLCSYSVYVWLFDFVARRLVYYVCCLFILLLALLVGWLFICFWLIVLIWFDSFILFIYYSFVQFDLLC